MSKKKAQYKTVVAASDFNKLDALTRDAFLERGHRITGITLAGVSKIKNDERISVSVPASIGTGERGRALNATKMVYQRAVVNSLSIANLDEWGLDKLKHFLSKKPFTEFEFTVKRMTTQHRETGKEVLWSRKSVSNGGTVMGLVLTKVEGVPFEEIDYKDIVAVADDMVEDACIYETTRIDFRSPTCAKP